MERAPTQRPEEFKLGCGCRQILTLVDGIQKANTIYYCKYHRYFLNGNAK